MFETKLIPRLARELHDAERTRIQIPQFSQRYPDMTLEDGYRIGCEWVRIKVEEGQQIRGRKIGLTSRAMQQAAQLDEPDYGVLLDQMFFENGGDIPYDQFIMPRVEIEIAFILKSALKGPGVTIFDVINATDHIIPSAEIIDSRLVRVDPETGSTRKIVDTIADNAANAGVVLGGAPSRPQDVNLRWQGGIIFRNGIIEETGLGGGVLGHPANGVAWLANRIAPWDEQLNAGDVVLAGSFTRPVDAARGDVFHLEFDALGSISFRFS